MTDEATKPRVVLIDLSSLFWTAWMINHENGVKEARSITLANVKRCVGEGSPLVAICTDEGRSFRKDVSPDYKATRERQPEAAYGELQKTKDRLRADGYLLWGADRFEADDIISTATQLALDAGHDVRVCSGDKDMFQLIGPRVDVLRTNDWSVWSPSTVMEKLGVKPVQVGDFLGLQGDTSDNIPGCEGVGKVRAAELLTKFGTIAKMYRAIDSGENITTPKLLESLKANRAAVELSRQLVELRFDAPIEFGQIYQERRVTSLTEKSESLPSDGDPTDESAPAATEPEATSKPPSSDSLAVSPSTAEPVQTALAVVEYNRQLEPRSLRAAVWLGQHLFDSRLYQKFGTPEAITAVIIRGRELGLGATTALDCFHVIEGKPTPYAYLMIARAKAHPDCEYFQCVEANDKQATWTTKNRCNPTTTSVTYTLEQAKAANLYKGGWLKNPEDMLVKTAGAKLARREYPDAALGLYAVVEMGGDE